MFDSVLSAYEDPSRHAAISEIIRTRSSNAADLREAVLSGLDLSFARSALDLGCGFGFLTDTIAARLAPDAQIVGLDACRANENAYLARVARTGRSVRFIHEHIDTRLDWPDESFDLVIASFSLYFFASVVPEIARVLTPGGMFLTITHTEKSCRDLLRVAGLPGPNSRLLDIVRQFSVESADEVLKPWFGEIERIDYRNSLTFEPAHRDDLLTYLRFKLPLLAPKAHPGGDLPAPLSRAVRTALSRQGRVVLEKDDAVFRCRRLRCQ